MSALFLKASRVWQYGELMQAVSNMTSERVERVIFAADALCVVIERKAQVDLITWVLDLFQCDMPSRKPAAVAGSS